MVCNFAARISDVLDTGKNILYKMMYMGADAGFVVQRGGERSGESMEIPPA